MRADPHPQPEVFIGALAAVVLGLSGIACSASEVPFIVSDYDAGDVYWIRDGAKVPIHGMREAWVFNRALAWIDPGSGGPPIVISTRFPLPLTGRDGASRWFAGPGGEVSEEDAEFSRFERKGGGPAVDHVSLPPLQFPIEAHPVAVLEVRRATGPWQLAVAVKGRSGPPLFSSPWRDGPGTLRVELLDIYRRKGHLGHYAELQFALFLAGDPGSARSAVFRLHLDGRPAVVPSLPVFRSRERAEREGAPICAAVLDASGRLLRGGETSVRAVAGVRTIDLAESGDGVWRGTVRGLPAGEHRAEITATGKDGSPPVRTALDIHITDGRFVGYDPALRLLTIGGKPIGPITGSYRGAPMFRSIGLPGESLVQGAALWEAVKGDRHEGQHGNHGPCGPAYGFHFWESMTEAELGADHAYLARCGWTLLHLCQGWWVWERLDAGGRLAPHGAERLAAFLASAARHGLKVHLAVSHYPLGHGSAPWSGYLEAGYRKEDYGRLDSRFYAMFDGYLRDLAAVFADATALSSYTSAGEGDPYCGKTFVNHVAEVLGALDPNHLFLCEPHHLPRPYPLDVNSYRREGWKPLLGGMRTYAIDKGPFEHIAVQYKLAGMGDIFLGEGVFWGFNDGARSTDRYRIRIRQTIYTGLVHRLPILLTWEERVAEDERLVFERVRKSVDWSARFARPCLAIRLGGDPDGLIRHERALSRIPLEYAFLGPGDPVPAGTLHVIDTREPFREPAFESEGGALPEALRADVPLHLPPGFVASFSRSEDGRTLLAYVQEAGGKEDHAAGTTEAGPYTYADTLRALDSDRTIAAWEVECVRPGEIRLCLFRREGEEILLVGSSDIVRMERPGLFRLALPKPIEGRKGDILGCHIPAESTHVAAETGGRMLFLEGREPGRRIPLSAWKSEEKTLRIRALDAGEIARPLAGAAGEADQGKAPREIGLNNFPDAPSSYSLFDLEEKALAAGGKFRRTATIPLPRAGRHFFVLVTGEE